VNSICFVNEKQLLNDLEADHNTDDEFTQATSQE